MSNPLPKLYRDRATSAPSAPDLDEVMRDVHTRVERRARRRRTGLAAGGSALAVAALATGAVVITTSGSDDGGQSAADPRPHSSAAVTSTGATPTAGSSPMPAGRLVAITTPKRAPLALGQVPEHFRYLGSAQTATTYGPPSVKNRDPNVFSDKLAVLVGTRYKHPAYKDRIAGLPAQIRDVNKGGVDTVAWIVDLDYNAKIELTIQVPASANLDRATVRQMAQTLDIRDVSHRARG